MGRGSSGSGGSGGELGGGSGKSINIKDQVDMISSRDPNNQQQVDGVLTVSKQMVDKYGDVAALEGTFQIATLGGQDAVSVLGFYDPDKGGISMNTNLMDSTKADSVYDKCVADGYHPSRGNKSGVEAIAAHEYGHALADAYGRMMGYNDIDMASKDIVTKAMKSMGQSKGSKGFAAKISGYAQENYAECVAEACSDVYCNGNNARAESRAIVAAIDKVLLKK